MNFTQMIKMIFSALSTIFIYLFGALDIALQSLLVFICLDYITGFLKGYKTNTLNSKIGKQGIIKKVGLLCLVAIAVVIDRITGDSGLIRTSVIYYLVANEGLSIIENLGEIGIIVPETLKERLEQLKDKK